MDNYADPVERDSFIDPSNSGIACIAGFFFCIRLAVPFLTMKGLGVDPQTGSEIRLALGALLLIAVCFTSLGSPTKRFIDLFESTSVRWAILFLVFSGLSFFWSETASALASFAYWMGTATDVITVLLLLRAGAVSEVAVSLMKGFIWGSCCIALIAWILPVQYDLRLGDEDFFNSNSICNVCVFAVFFAQYLIRQKRGSWGSVIVFLVFTIVRSLSKTTIAAFLVGEVYLLIQDRSMSRRTKLYLTMGAVFTILIFWSLFEDYYNFYTTNGNQAQTLTGRTAIWAYIYDAGMERPWIGHGFDSMWNVVPVFGTFEARHAENEILELFYSFGAMGIFILCGTYGSMYRSARRLADTRLQIVFVSAVFFVLVRGLAEADPFDLLFPLWMVIMIGALIRSLETEEEKVADALPASSDVKSPAEFVSA